MINVYQSIITHEHDDWEEYFNKICLIDIFGDIIAKYGNDRTTLKSFIKYIVWCYSKESDMVIIGSDWLKNKKRIFDAAEFKPIDVLLNASVHLQDPTVLKTVQRWMDFQNDAVYTQLCVLKDLMVEMQLSANGRVVKSSGEIDYDQKYKNACYVDSLRKMINDLESELIQNTPKLKEAYREVRQQASKKNTKSTEEIFASNG